MAELVSIPGQRTRHAQSPHDVATGTFNATRTSRSSSNDPRTIASCAAACLSLLNYTNTSSAGNDANGRPNPQLGAPVPGPRPRALMEAEVGPSAVQNDRIDPGAGPIRERERASRSIQEGEHVVGQPRRVSELDRDAAATFAPRASPPAGRGLLAGSGGAGAAPGRASGRAASPERRAGLDYGSRLRGRTDGRG